MELLKIRVSFNLKVILDDSGLKLIKKVRKKWGFLSHEVGWLFCIAGILLNQIRDFST